MQIATGKLRRYFDLKNFTDPFRIIRLFQAFPIEEDSPGCGLFKRRICCRSCCPRCACPEDSCDHSRIRRMTPGLANKLCIPVVSKVCCNFPETLKYLPSDKAVLSGSPIRSELFEGDRSRGLHFCGLTSDKPVILIMGGSLGAVAVNEAVRAVLPELLKDFQVIHLCGKGKTDKSLSNMTGYVQYEFIKERTSRSSCCCRSHYIPCRCQCHM